MKTSLEHYSVKELTDFEILSINAGKEAAKTTSLWEDAGFVLGLIARRLVEFSTEGGRNAGIIV